MITDSDLEIIINTINKILLPEIKGHLHPSIGVSSPEISISNTYESPRNGEIIEGKYLVQIKFAIQTITL